MRVVNHHWSLVSMSAFSFTLCASLFALCSSAEAQQPAKGPRIGYLSRIGDSKNPGPQVVGFRQGLRDLGYSEGKNILVEYHYIEGKSDSIEALRRNSFNSKSMSLSLDLYQRSAQLSRRPRRSLLS